MNGHKPFVFTVSDELFTPRTIAMIKSFRYFDSTTPLLCVITDRISANLLELSKTLNFEVQHLNDILQLETISLVQGSRTYIEQMWTYPSVILSSLIESKFDYTDVLYLDADIYFFGNLSEIWEEIPLGNIGIIEHKFSPRLAEIFTESGKFNVSWVSIPTTILGIACAKSWAEKCLIECPSTARHEGEELIYGDQGYLNSWPKSFPNNVTSISHLGAGVAPWNFEQYKITKIQNEIFIDNKPLIFYHFSSHQFGFKLARKMGTTYSAITRYPKIIYQPYEEQLVLMASLLQLERWRSRYRPFKERMMDNFRLRLTKLNRPQN